MNAARKMFDVEADIHRVLDLVAENGGELTDAQAAELDALEGERNQKWLASAHVVKRLLDDSERLSKMAKRAAGQAEWLKANVLRTMQAAGVDKVPGDTIGLRLQKNPPSAEILDEAAIPDTFKVPPPPPPPPSVDRRAVLAALKEGKDVPGARLAEVRFHLRIT